MTTCFHYRQQFITNNESFLHQVFVMSWFTVYNKNVLALDPEEEID